MKMAKPAGMAPRAVAEALAEQLSQVPGIAAVDIAGPGFINITLEVAAAGEIARAAVVAGPEFGRSDTLAGVAVDASSSPRTRPDRCTWVIPGGRQSVTPWRGCWRRPALRSRASST